MFTCFICKNTFINTNILLRHFDFQHSDHTFDVYNCAEGECSRLFYLKDSYIKHLLKHRKDLVQISLHSQVLLEDNTPLESTATTKANSDFLPPSNVSSNSKFTIEPVEILNQRLCTFLACLYANPIKPRNAVQIVVDGMETVLSEGIGVFVKSSAQKLLSEGTYWQSRAVTHNERVVFLLFVFFDNFESGNALGSHSGIHKLGVYVSLPCLPSYLSTVLFNIFFALIFHISDRVEFGNRIIFQPLMDELNFLQ
ncbi:hypothetical protein QTP88_012053 [Uroleucon formosanum]